MSAPHEQSDGTSEESPHASLSQFTTTDKQPGHLSMSFDDRGPSPSAWRRRHRNSIAGNNTAHEVQKAQREGLLVSFKYKDTNGDLRKIKVSVDFKPGTFNNFLSNLSQGFWGSSKKGDIKVKYIDDEGDEVLLATEDDLVSCLEDCKHSGTRTVHLRISMLSTSLPTKEVSSSTLSTLSSKHSADAQNSVPDTPKDDRSSAHSADMQPTIIKKKNVSFHSDAEKAMQPGAIVKARKARGLMLENNFAESIKMYEEILQADSNNPWALCGRAAAHLLNGDEKVAEDDYRAAIALMDNEKKELSEQLTLQMCMQGLIEAFITQKRYEEAAAIASRMDESQKQSEFVELLRAEVENQSRTALPAMKNADFGEALLCYGDAIRAEAAYLQLVPSAKRKASLRLGRALCYKAMDDYMRALKDYEAAVMLKPDSLGALKGCAECLFELGQFDKAVEFYERARKIDPGDKEIIKGIEAVMSLQAGASSEKKDPGMLGRMLKNSVRRKPSSFGLFRKD